MAKKIPITPGIVEEFYKRVKKRAGDDCWQWQGMVGSRGVGHFTINGRRLLATHVSWEIHHGRPLPKDAVVAHECHGNRGCVRPDHLVVLTRLQARRRKGATAYLHLSKDFPGGLLTGEQLEAVRQLVAPSPSDTLRLVKSISAQVTALGRVLDGLNATVGALAKGSATKADVEQLARVVAQVAEEQRVSRETLDALRQGNVSRETSPPPAPPPSGPQLIAPEPAPEEPDDDVPVAAPKLGDVLAKEFVQAVTGVPIGDPGEPLEEAFDLAVLAAGGNPDGALLTLRSWFAAYAEHKAEPGATPPSAADFFSWCARLTDADHSAAR